MPFWHSHGLVCPRQLLLPSQTGQDHGCFRCNQSHNVKLPEQPAVSSLLHPELSLESGFNSISTFNRVFLKSKNVSPTDFRQMYLQSYQK